MNARYPYCIVLRWIWLLYGVKIRVGLLNVVETFAYFCSLKKVTLSKALLRLVLPGVVRTLALPAAAESGGGTWLSRKALGSLFATPKRFTNSFANHFTTSRSHRPMHSGWMIQMSCDEKSRWSRKAPKPGILCFLVHLLSRSFIFFVYSSFFGSTGILSDLSPVDGATVVSWSWSLLKLSYDTLTDWEKKNVHGADAAFVKKHGDHPDRVCQTNQNCETTHMTVSWLVSVCRMHCTYCPCTMIISSWSNRALCYSSLKISQHVLVSWQVCRMEAGAVGSCRKYIIL